MSNMSWCKFDAKYQIVNAFYAYAIKSTYDYAAPAFITLTKTRMKKLGTLQNRAVRALDGAFHWTKERILQLATNLQDLTTSTHTLISSRVINITNVGHSHHKISQQPQMERI